ncbi:MAG: hypothetical protein V4577_13785 [Bacteroidota bacterium]
MKNLKRGFLAVALIAGVSGAFLTKAAHAAKPVDTLYNWTSTSIAPSNPSSTYNGHTVLEAENHFGCVNGAQDCADGIKVSGPGSGTFQLRFN